MVTQSSYYMYYIKHRRAVDVLNSRPRTEVRYLAYQLPFYALCYTSSGCDVMAHHYGENSQFLQCSNLQVDMPYIKPVRPYLNARKAEARAVWHVRRPFVLRMIYQVLVRLWLIIYRENSPVSAAVRWQPFCRLICHISNLCTILKLLWWRHNNVIYANTGHQIAIYSQTALHNAVCTSARVYSAMLVNHSICN